MDITGYAASILIGISLGLIGGGGSILTVPVLVYLFAVDAVLATTYSLFIVGSASLVGSFSYFKKGFIDVKTAFIFGIPSIVAVYLSRTYLLTAIPEHVFDIGSFTVSKRILLMVLFALLMILAAYSMIKKGDEDKATDQKSASDFWAILQGFAVGMATGLIGAGGGFLIIPALANLLKLPIKTAIGTSLIIIAVNSLTGFTLSLEQTQIEWSFLLTVTLIAIAGIFIGTYVSTKIDGKKLRPAFGYFVLAMGIYIIAKETLLK